MFGGLGFRGLVSNVEAVLSGGVLGTRDMLGFF